MSKKGKRNSGADEMCQHHYNLAIPYLQDVGNPYIVTDGLEFGGIR